MLLSHKTTKNLFVGVNRVVTLVVASALGALALVAMPAQAATDGWTKVDAALVDTQVMVASGDGSHILVSSWYGLNISTDFGATWITKAPAFEAWQTVAVSSDGNMMFADNTSSAGGGLWKSTDTGSTWSKLSGVTFKPYGTTISGDGQTIATTDIDTGALWISVNSGTTWTKAAFTSAWVQGTVSGDGSTIAAGDDTELYVSRDKGATWTKRRAAGAFAHIIYAIALSNNGSTIALTQVGDGANDLGSVAVSTNYGVTWTSTIGTTLPTGNEMFIAMSADGQKIVTAVPQHQIYRSTDFGATWTLQDVSIPSTLQGISSSLLGDVVTIFQEKTAIFRGNFSVPAAVPSVPVVSAVKFPGAGKATVSWSAASANGATVTKYEYCYLKCTKASSWKSTKLVRSITIKGLKKKAVVTIQVRATNSVGKSKIVSKKFTQSK